MFISVTRHLDFCIEYIYKQEVKIMPEKLHKSLEKRAKELGLKDEWYFH